MVRTQIYLTDTEKNALAEMAGASGKKQSELIREAIDSYVARHHAGRRREILERLAGMWADHEDLPSFEELRGSWDRQG